ncbi:E3 ubiquitin-protein ligase BRE1B-like isoform X2 [Lineus longissimus]|uniref:E3 ubiquitin-protein ligase BRE1B-like isoform X2 n=1 Tax=Lineus longissimus TaxID=88925 RepID=UPI00315D49AF
MSSTPGNTTPGPSTSNSSTTNENSNNGNNGGTKRNLDTTPTTPSGPPTKKKVLTYCDVKMGPVHSLEEMDMKVLLFQNKKLSEKIEQRRKAEEELRKRIEQLEKRQTTDDAVLCIVNRYWNQLDEDVRVLLQRFDAETADENENENQSEAITSFLTQLSTWDKHEIEESLHRRVELSKRAIGKLLLAFDRLLQRNERLRKAMYGEDTNKDLTDSLTEKKDDMETEGEGRERSLGDNDPDREGDIDEKQDQEKLEKDEPEDEFNLDEAVKDEMKELQVENKRLHNLITELHEFKHNNSLKQKEYQEKLSAAETEVDELRNKTDDLEYDLGCAKEKIVKLEKELSEDVKLHPHGNFFTGPPTCETKGKFNELMGELEDQREMAQNRLSELEKLQQDHQDSLKEIEKLKMDLQSLPDSVILGTTEYKCLQAQFSVLYNESMQMRNQLEESRNLLQTSKNAHLRHIEQMESDELACQKKLRTEVMQLEDTLSQVRKEYEMLRIEFEQTLAANEQTGPINREMRNLITSLQNHNHQLKGEVGRYKRKLREGAIEINKLKAENHQNEPKVEKKSESESDSAMPVKQEEPPVPIHVKKEPEEEPIEKEKEEKVRPIKERRKTPREDDMSRMSESETLKDLKQQLKKSQDSQKEMKLLLDMYKSAPKDQRDKVQLQFQLMSAEKKARQEIDDLKSCIQKMRENERKEKRKLADEDAIRKIKKMEETINDLQKKLDAQKQEEEALLNEMEVTGQAFEDMQEQNIRLLQQLREKDDANFKLMSERIKSNQIHKLLREEKEVLAEQVATLQSQVEAQNLVVRKLEEKERILQNNLATVEKELNLRQQAMELHKRKAIESAQSAADLKLHLDKYTAQLRDLQNSVAEKTGTLEKESFKYKRMQEEQAILRRKLERHKKIELAGTADEVLMEEIKEYKEQLTCPSCKVKKKDAILTKCFHVFCLECLRTRYETRQRKCPKCNAAFGANDFHRIYLDN